MDDDTDGTKGHRAQKVFGGVLSVVYRISRLVLLLLAVVVLLGIVFTKTPTNDANTIVSHVLDLARTVAGPFKDVFAPKDKENALVVNYALAAGVYFVLAYIVGKLPTGGKR